MTRSAVLNENLIYIALYKQGLSSFFLSERLLAAEIK